MSKLGAWWFEDWSKMDNFTKPEAEDEQNQRKFKSTVFIISGSLSLFLSLLICLLNVTLVAARLKNNQNFHVEKAIDRFHTGSFVIYILAGTVLLPYFGITEVTHGAKQTTPPSSFPSYTSVLVVFFAGSNLLVMLFITIERHSAFVYPHANSRIMTRSNLTWVFLLIHSFSLLFALSSLTGVRRDIFNCIFIHLFFSAPISVSSVMILITYRNIKNRNRIVNVEIPQRKDYIDLRRRRNVGRARKYVLVASLFWLPSVMSSLPWYIITLVRTSSSSCVDSKVCFFWERLSIPLLFIPDVLLPIVLVFRFHEYSVSIKHLLRR